MNTRKVSDVITEKPVVKFFRSFETMQRYCNYRYGRDNATAMLDEPRHYYTTAFGNARVAGHLYWFHTKNGKVGFEQTKADKDYTPLTDEDRVNWGPEDLQARASACS